MKVAIIGAGPAGITAAYELARNGTDVEVFETRSVSGGLAGTIGVSGHHVDTGPHRFFSRSPKVNALWDEVARGRSRVVKRYTRIFYRGVFFQYPLSLPDVLGKIGLAESCRCLASFLARGREPRSVIPSFEDVVVSFFGRRLFEHFFKSYSEKLWGLPCSDIDQDFAGQRIRKLSLSEAVLTALPWSKSSRRRTLLDVFSHPENGIGTIWKNMAEAVKSKGGRINFSTPVRGIIVQDGRCSGIELADGRRVAADHVVSSMPLPELVSSLSGVPAVISAAGNRLRFRNTVIVYFHSSSEDLFPDQWIYVHAQKLRTGRITNSRNWGPVRASGTVLAMEYWCGNDDGLWRAPDIEVFASARAELLSLLSDMDRPADAPDIRGAAVVRLERSYPIYHRGYKADVKAVERHLSGIAGLTLIGRGGTFKYNNMDHSMLMGLLAAENIAGGASHDLWDINTDYDDYQETASTSQPLQTSTL